MRASKFITQKLADFGMCHVFIVTGGGAILLNDAIGNFIRDALRGGPIIVNGDGTPCRSYFYASDFAIWLWTILFSGKNYQAYNIGSVKPLSITELAYFIANNFPEKLEVNLKKDPLQRVLPEKRYVPSVEKAKAELKFTELVALNKALQLSEKWLLMYK